MRVNRRVLIAALAALALAGGLRTAAAENGGTGDGICHVPAEYSTIQDAVDAADTGDTVLVAAGTYDESITIAKGISVIGAGADQTTITASGYPEYLVLLGSFSGMQLDPGPVLEGFTLVPDAFLYTQDLVVLGASGTEEHPTTIRDCVLDGLDTPSSPTYFVGLDAPKATSHLLIEGNAFRNCWYGVALDRPGYATIRDNTIESTEFAALTIAGGAAGSDGPHDLVISGNTIKNAGYLANTWTGVPASFFAAIALGKTAQDVTVTGNTLTGNYGCGFVIRDYGSGTSLSNVHVNQNTIAGNGGGAVNEVATVVDLTENWWGDASGPSGGVADPVSGTLANGSGDSVSTYLRFDPWLSGPPSTGGASAHDLAAGAAGALEGLSPTGDQKTDGRIEHALDHLAKALDEDLWADGDHLAGKDGKKVLDELKKAAKEVAKILEQDDAPAADLGPVLEDLVAAAAKLVQTALDEADQASTDEKVRKEIAKAEDEVAKAEAEWADGEAEKAIDHLKKAWELLAKAAGG